VQKADVVVVGAGIVGLAAAWTLAQKRPDLKIIVIDKEPAVAAHQTGRNSGVVHSGIYYKPGSLKAATCRRGLELIRSFAEREGVDYHVCGKVIVACDEEELPALQELERRGKANGVTCVAIDRNRLLELEPHVNGIAALHVTETAIIDYVGFCEKMAEKLKTCGQQVILGEPVIDLKETTDSVEVVTPNHTISTNYLLNCAGLYSDHIVTSMGIKPEAKIIPFRGEYYELTPEAEKFCRTLIYPVPDSRFPFLGVHFTRMVKGGVECGPNAVLAFAREGYTLTTVNFGELAETLSYTGFLKLAARHWRTGSGEMWRSISRRAFVKALQKLVPEIQLEHLNPAPAGVRAQAVTRDGKLVEDFSLHQGPRTLHVVNAPSPAATASLAIGEEIVRMIGL
jgi:L-2-hydroxyglutarate oxidase